jgi:hypothetical protein
MLKTECLAIFGAFFYIHRASDGNNSLAAPEHKYEHAKPWRHGYKYEHAKPWRLFLYVSRPKPWRFPGRYL